MKTGRRLQERACPRQRRHIRPLKCLNDAVAGKHFYRDESMQKGLPATG
jgi:hypothetical protein